MKKPAIVLAALAMLTAVHSEPVAQLRLQPVVDQQGKVGLGLALRRLNSVGTLMMTTAHPDDENNALLAQVGLGEGWRTTLVSATRGDGGQNEIGPELFDALAVLRTEELAAAHRFDGAEQFFTRAVDFGYSFSIDETYQKWGREEILGDFVRLIRTTRPDVIVGFIWEGRGGGQHHQTSARLTAEAFRAAADPNRFPEQIREGLRPWQAKKFYYSQGFFGRQEAPAAGPKTLAVNSNVYDPLLGRTYTEIGAEARSMHKCQGMAQVLPLPGAGEPRRYTLHDTTLDGGPGRPDASVIDGIDSSLAGLAQFAGPTPPAALTSALDDIAAQIAAASNALAARGPDAAVTPLAAGFTRLVVLRKALGAMGLSGEAAYDIDFRLQQKERQFRHALVLANGLRLDALADDGLVVPGQKVNVSLRAVARGSTSVSVTGTTIAGLDITSPACADGTTVGGRVFECRVEAVVPATAKVTAQYFRRLPDFARYEFDADVPFGLPARPTPFRATVQLSVAGVSFPWELPIEYRYEGNIFSGEKRMELTVVPAMALRLTPEIAIVPTGVAPQRTQATREAPGREVRVSVINHAKGAATGEVRLELPAGWTATPATAPVAFSREDEAITVRFRMMPQVKQPGEYQIAAKARSGQTDYDLGYQVIEYPHTQRRHVVEPAHAHVKVLDVKIAPGLTVGYVMGVGDQVPPAIEQLGARVELLSSDDLAWGDLSRYDVIVTGVRAYERRMDLRASNNRLLEYARRGGTVLVQYNKFEFNDAQFGPYPIKVSSNRVTDEAAPVTVLVPAHPVFSTPNRIDASAWTGWVQERGLYFLGDRDPQYVDLVEAADTFEYNAGVKRGALVEARVGKGRWIYIGLNLWRQLPAGTEGAYRLMANLVSLGGASGGGAAGNP